MTERTWMKKCCEHCPFKEGTKLVLHPERAEQFANMASNPYNDFPCHKTADIQEEDELRGIEGGYVHGDHSFTCHGFKAMQLNECGNEKDMEIFKSDRMHFVDYFDMVDYHTQAYEDQNARRASS